jgi:hypothetical protein
MPRVAKRPLWKCPECGHSFVTRNLSHSCVRVPMSAHFLDAGLWLRRKADHPRLRKIEDFGRLGQVHHFRLESPDDVDAALETLIREAYRVGTQELTARSMGV